MNKLIYLIILFSGYLGFESANQTQFSTNQGQINFFSYTSVENIEAQNNQVLSIIDIEKKEIAVSILMNAFVFKKALMRQHFNDSYMQSDLYPKAFFEGNIIDFDPNAATQTKMVKGNLTIRDITKEFTIKTNIEKKDKSYLITGDFDITIEDYKIKIPPLLVPNIAKTINTKFNFELQPNEK